MNDVLIQNWYFTFGCGQPHENRYHVIPAESRDEARVKMAQRFGRQWSMQYTEEEWQLTPTETQAQRYNLEELP